MQQISKNNTPYFLQLLVLIGFVLLGAGVFSILALGIITLASGGGIDQIFNLASGVISSSNINQLKVMQIFVSTGMFILPAIIFSLLYGSGLGYLKLNKLPNGKSILLVITTLFFSAGLINFLMEINQSVSFPSFLKELEQWMIQSEKQAEAILEKFMEMNSFSDLAINLLMIGIIPGLGEELLFRGVLQQLLGNWTRNQHIGIWLSAIIFSAIHLQFFGFLPRMFLGVLFGYFFFWSGNLWLPIISHLIFNGSQVLMVYLYKINIVETNIEEVETIPWYAVVASIIISSYLLYILYHYFKPRTLSS